MGDLEIGGLDRAGERRSASAGWRCEPTETLGKIDKGSTGGCVRSTQGGQRNGQSRTPLIAAIVAGIAIMAFCCPLAAHFSRQAASAWMKETGRFDAAYSDAVKAAGQGAGQKSGGLSKADLERAARSARKNIWSDAYDPEGSTRDQRKANVIGLFGVLGFFLTVGASVLLVMRQAKGSGKISSGGTGP